jgi:hypothetical protein
LDQVNLEGDFFQFLFQAKLEGSFLELSQFVDVFDLADALGSLFPVALEQNS